MFDNYYVPNVERTLKIVSSSWYGCHLSTAMMIANETLDYNSVHASHSAEFSKITTITLIDKTRTWRHYTRFVQVNVPTESAYQI
jgi:hypothetical protein